MKELLEELKDIEDQLENLYNMGCNDESLVDERRRVQTLIRNYGL